MFGELVWDTKITRKPKEYLNIHIVFTGKMSAKTYQLVREVIVASNRLFDWWFRQEDGQTSSFSLWFHLLKSEIWNTIDRWIMKTILPFQLYLILLKPSLIPVIPSTALCGDPPTPLIRYSPASRWGLRIAARRWHWPRSWSLEQTLIQPHIFGRLFKNSPRPTERV